MDANAQETIRQARNQLARLEADTRRSVERPDGVIPLADDRAEVQRLVELVNQLDGLLDGAPTGPQSVLSGHVAKQILAVRDALIDGDVSEAWHQLYSIASPTYTDLQPWEWIERIAALHSEEAPASEPVQMEKAQTPAGTTYYHAAMPYPAGTDPASADRPEPSEALPPMDMDTINALRDMNMEEGEIQIVSGDGWGDIYWHENARKLAALFRPHPSQSGQAVPEEVRQQPEKLREAADELRDLGDSSSANMMEGIADDLERALATHPADGDSPAVPDNLRNWLDELRGQGLMVAVHNDYRQNGEHCTFWLFVGPNGMSYKGEGRSDAEALNQVRSALATHPADGDSPAVPKGCVLVPKEPTEAMLLAGMDYIAEEATIRRDDSGKRVVGINPALWKSMIAASPTPPSDETSAEGEQ